MAIATCRVWTAARDDPTHRVGHFIELLDLAIHDPALLKGLAGQPLEHQVPGCGLTQLHQLHAGGADVQTHHLRMFPACKAF
jgi:hypothetical protein